MRFEDSCKKINRFQSAILALILAGASAPAGSFAASPGLIPLDDAVSQPSTDLVLNGTVLTVPAAQKLRNSGADLSNLNPAESDIWKNVPPPATVTSDPLVINGATVSYDSTLNSRAGNFRFVAFNKTSTGNQAFDFYVSREAHNLLLRRALLSKLGYQVQAANRLAQVTVRFRSKIERENFIEKMRAATFASPQDRWIVSQSADGLFLTLQDIVVTASDLQSYNLAVGFVPTSIIAGRRALNALLVPFSLVYIPESVNLYSWRAGSINNQKVGLDCEDSDQFYTSYADAKWITLRILGLSRKDFQDIVDAAGYPQAVGNLILEKLISRRNSLRSVLGLSGADLSFSADVSLPPDLLDGKLQKEKWDGYGSHFSHGDPESPLSASGIWAYIQSQALSMAIQTGIGELSNYTVYPDLNTALAQKQMDRVNQSFQVFAQTGQLQSTTFGVDNVPFGGAQLIVSRDIVTGTYMGSDELVQLADSIGLSLNAGVALAAYGLPSGVTVQAQGAAFINRIYTHFKPVTSVTAALKTPFRQLLVPLIKHEFGQTLDGVSNQPAAYFGTPEGHKKLSDIVGQFKNTLQIKESLVIADSIGGGLGAGAGYGLNEWVQAKATFSGSQIVISRLQIYRSSENEIQIYRDRGDMGAIGVRLEADALAPVFTASVALNRGNVGTQYYRVDLTEDTKRNPNLIKNLQAIRALLLTNSLEVINDLQKPIQVDHQVRDVTTDLALLVWRWRSENTRDVITLTAPSGAKKSYLRYMTGQRSGEDYQDFAIDIAAGLLKHYVARDLSLNRLGNSDPGTTFEGTSRRRVITFESELTGWDGFLKGQTAKDFVRIERHWKGWKANKDDAQDIVNEINNLAGKAIFPALSLNNTDSVQLYDFALMIYIYDLGIAKLRALTPDQYGKIIRAYTHTDKSWIVENFTNLQIELEAAILKNDARTIGKKKTELVDLVEDNLPLAGVAEAVGGIDNLYIFGSMSGFRSGVEEGDQALTSDTLGQIGSFTSQGPLTGIQRQMGMTDTEFLSYWMFDRM